MDYHVVDLTLVGVHQNSTAATTNIINRVAAGIENGWGTDDRTACGGSDKLQSEHGMAVHRKCVLEKLGRFKRSDSS